MAYLRDLDPGECLWPGCKKKAAVEVVNNRNAPCGKYCRKHGSMMRDKILRQEKD